MKQGKAVAQDRSPKSSQYMPEIERVLVVISPDLVQPGSPEKSPLLTRALLLASETGCDLELFHVCYDEAGPASRFRDEDEIQLQQKKLFDLEKKQMIKLAENMLMSENLRREDVNVTHDTRWESQRSAAILQKIADFQPDLLIKQSRDHNYLLGIASNTDWELIRQSSAHLWFVAEKQFDSVDGLIAAVGTNGDVDVDEIFGDADYDVLRMANLIGGIFKAHIVPVHAFQTPAGWGTYAAYAPVFGADSNPIEAGFLDTKQQLQQAAKDHGEHIEAFAKYFQIEPSSIRLALGHPSDVIAATASEENAQLIVMAARNLSRWERFRETTTAEKVLSKTLCDVLFVKDQAISADTDDGAQRATTSIHTN